MKRPGRQIALRTGAPLPDPRQGRLPNILERMATGAAGLLGDRLGHNFVSGPVRSRPIQFNAFDPGESLICQGRLKNMNCGLVFALAPRLGALLTELALGGTARLTEEMPPGPAGKAILTELGIWLGSAFGHAWSAYSANEFFEAENIFQPPDGQLPFESREQMLECSFYIQLAEQDSKGEITMLFPWREIAAHARMLSGPPMPPVSFGQHVPDQAPKKRKKGLLAWLFPKTRFAALLRLPDLAIARLLAAETPQLQAAVLAFLPRARANGILSHLDESIRKRCSSMGLINADLLDIAEDGLSRRAAKLNFAEPATPGHI